MTSSASILLSRLVLCFEALDELSLLKWHCFAIEDCDMLLNGVDLSISVLRDMDSIYFQLIILLKSGMAGTWDGWFN